MQLIKICLMSICTIWCIGQLKAQNQNFNLNLLANWDIDTMPSAGSITYNDCWGYVDCTGREYGIMGSASYTHFFDLEDSTNPIEINFYAAGANTIWRDYKTYRNYVYGVCDSCNEGLQVFDMSYVPDSVSKVLQTDAFFGKAHNIFIDTLNAKLYAPGTNTQSNGLVILDLSQTPENPTLISSIALPGGYVHDLYVRNDTAYCSHGFNGLYVYDLADPQNPVILGILDDYPQSGYNHSSWLSNDGNHLIMADETHNTSLKIVNTSDLSDMDVTSLFRSTLLAPADTASIVHNPFVRGDYVFLSYYHDGVQVYDFSDPNQAVKVASYDTDPDNDNYAGFRGCWGVYPYFPSGNIIASDVRNGLFVLEPENLEIAPIVAASYPVVEIVGADNTNLCEWDTLSLSLSEEMESISWVLDSIEISTEPNIQLSEEGMLQVIGSNQHCTSSSELINLNLTIVPESIPTITPEGPYCDGDTITFTVEAVYDSIQWYQNNELIQSGSLNTLQVSTNGSISYIYSINDCALTSDNYDAIIELDPNETILLAGSAISITDLYDSYQWYFNDELLENANSASLDISATGSYFVEYTTNQGCVFYSDVIDYVSSTFDLKDLGIHVYPNPVQSNKLLLNKATLDKNPYQIFDLNGKLIQEGQINGQGIELIQPLNGIYMLQIWNNKTTYHTKFSAL